MSHGQRQPFLDSARLTAYAISIVGTFLIVAMLVWAMRHYTQPAPVGDTVPPFTVMSCDTSVFQVT